MQNVRADVIENGGASSRVVKEPTHDEMHLGRSAFRDAEAPHCSSQGCRIIYIEKEEGGPRVV